MHLLPVHGVGVHGACVEPALADGVDELPEAGRQGVGTGPGRGQDAAEQVDDHARAVAGRAVRLKDGRKPARLDRGDGQCSLSLEGPLQFSPFLRGQLGIHRFGDRDEGHRVGDGEQRQADPIRGGHQFSRRCGRPMG